VFTRRPARDKRLSGVKKRALKRKEFIIGAGRKAVMLFTKSGRYEGGSHVTKKHSSCFVLSQKFRFEMEDLSGSKKNGRRREGPPFGRQTIA